jgi:hypothetical protein
MVDNIRVDMLCQQRRHLVDVAEPSKRAKKEMKDNHQVNVSAAQKTPSVRDDNHRRNNLTL